MTTAKRIGLVLGLIFFGIILSLFSYALIPVKQKSEDVWAVDDKKYDMAYVTLATTDNSVLGVLTLAYTLRETLCKYPLVVLIADQVSESYRTVPKMYQFKHSLYSGTAAPFPSHPPGSHREN